jgi:hypothetical protein
MSETVSIRPVRFSILIASLLILSGMLVVSYTAEAGAAAGVRSLSSACGWEQIDWSDMSGTERKLWSRLGWNQGNWDSNKAAPASESKDWDELSTAEKRSAATLGFSQKSWDVSCN